MQQFLDKHSRAVLAFPSPLRLIPPSGHANAVQLFTVGRRLCWRPHPRCALFLRRVTPTRSHFSRPDVAFVCAALPATPYSSVGSRQRVPTFPGRTSPLLAPPYPLRLIPSPRHANTIRIFPGGRRLCWRPPTRYALFLRLATPTAFDFSRADVDFVGVPLLTAPYFFASPRQHDRKFPGRTPPLLASPYPLRLISSSRQANTVWKFPDMLTYLGARKLKERDSLQ